MSINILIIAAQLLILRDEADADVMRSRNNLNVRNPPTKKSRRSNDRIREAQDGIVAKPSWTIERFLSDLSDPIDLDYMFDVADQGNSDWSTQTNIN